MINIFLVKYLNPIKKLSVLSMGTLTHSFPRQTLHNLVHGCKIWYSVLSERNIQPLRGLCEVELKSHAIPNDNATLIFYCPEGEIVKTAKAIVTWCQANSGSATIFQKLQQHKPHSKRVLFFDPQKQFDLTKDKIQRLCIEPYKHIVSSYWAGDKRSGITAINHDHTSVHGGSDDPMVCAGVQVLSQKQGTKRKRSLSPSKTTDSSTQNTTSESKSPKESRSDHAAPPANDTGDQCQTQDPVMNNGDQKPVQTDSSNDSQEHHAKNEDKLPTSHHTYKPGKPPKGPGVYVLQLSNGKYYVGKSENVEKRIKEHTAQSSWSSEWVKANLTPGSEPVYLIPQTHNEALWAWECRETLHAMLTFGFENVRGYHWCQKTLGYADWRSIQREICEQENLCHKCGRKVDHTSNPRHCVGVKKCPNSGNKMNWIKELNNLMTMSNSEYACSMTDLALQYPAKC